ncbi:MAG: hypothetical protein LBB65_07760, partial [Burkholderiales bacterium]|nr:hypothetical protein [Burkholderiales bacterium]
MSAPNSSEALTDRYARRHRALAWSWLGVLILLTAALLAHILPWRGQIDTDLLELLPVDERNPQAETALKTLTQHGERELVLLLATKDADTAPRAAHLVRESLLSRNAPLTAQAPQAQINAMRDLYFPYRAGLVTDQDLRWIAESESSGETQRALSLAYQPFAGGTLNWRDDPFGFFGNWMMQLGA